MAMGSSFGDLFRISTFGESHGGGVGVIVEGCPPRLNLSVESIQAELDRRKPGQSHITTPRKDCLLYKSPSPRDVLLSGMPASA